MIGWLVFWWFQRVRRQKWGSPGRRWIPETGRLMTSSDRLMTWNQLYLPTQISSGNMYVSTKHVCTVRRYVCKLYRICIYTPTQNMYVHMHMPTQNMYVHMHTHTQNVYVHMHTHTQNMYVHMYIHAQNMYVHMHIQKKNRKQNMYIHSQDMYYTHKKHTYIHTHNMYAVIPCDISTLFPPTISC